MDTLAHFVARPRPCSYLPGQAARMEYEVVAAMTAEEYLGRLEAGWRRFGRTLFRPRCLACAECRSLRVDALRFRPDRAMRRVRARNEGEVELTIAPARGRPDAEVLDLYDRYHEAQHRLRGWPAHEPGDPSEFRESFLDNPIPTEQWCYRVGGRLMGVGYVDALPGASSAIYFVYDHAHLGRSPGTWNVLCMLERAAEQGRRHVYLGYYVAGCRSLAYKARFAPNEVLGPGGGGWAPFRI